MEPNSSQPYPPQPQPGQPVSPQPMQNGQSISWQHQIPQVPGTDTGVPEWQRGLGQLQPTPYAQPQPVPQAGVPTPATASVPAPAVPEAATLQNAQAAAIPAAETALPQQGTAPASYQPHTPVHLPGRPSGTAYEVERPEPVARPAYSWQRPPAALSPNEISMPGPGTTAYQQPASAPSAPSPASVPPANTANYTQLATENTRHNRRPLFIIGAVVIVAAIALVAYFSFVRKGKDNTNSDAGLNVPGTHQALKLADSNTVTLVPPQDIDGYTQRNTGTASVRDFVSKDGQCELIIGTVSAGQLPGNNLNDIVKPQLDQLRTAGITIDGPKSGDILKLKDSKNSATTYSLDTLTYTYNDQSAQVVTHYSGAIMKNGDRAVVSRTCSGDGHIDGSVMKKLDDAASQISVTATK